MIVKVCGMKEKKNVEALLNINPTMIGFIFYRKSPRYTERLPETKFPDNIKKTGVFVNESLPEIEKIAYNNDLDYIQLHGEESPQMCKELKMKEFGVIKAFSIEETFDFLTTEKFSPYCNLFIFDTKGKKRGGTGETFDWEILKKYKGTTPFLLSGGLSIQHIEKLKNFSHPALAGYDINSRFEKAPGIKDIKKIKYFIEEVGHIIPSYKI